MPLFLFELKKRNTLFYWFGLINFIVGIFCILLMQLDSMEILGVSRWLKPMKFYFSIGILVWTLAWVLFYLDYKKSIRIISWVITVSMFLENFLVFMQAARGQRSHFNVQESTNALIFSFMGILILIFTAMMIWITILYMKQKQFSIPLSYLWGIRLGLVFFIIFSAEGGMMISKMSHTVGGIDGGVGFPLVNWSKLHGDLRIAHFLGIHSLQLLPFAGFYLFKKLPVLILFSACYFIFVVALFIMAMKGLPL